MPEVAAIAPPAGQRQLSSPHWLMVCAAFLFALMGVCVLRGRAPAATAAPTET